LDCVGKQVIKTTFKDGAEMNEEYDISTGSLVVRRWKSSGSLGSKATSWEYEIGEVKVSDLNTQTV
jgi:hypothetical protein